MPTRRRRCAFCKALLPKDARPNRKYCDADCRAGRAKKSADQEAKLGPVGLATEAAIAQAKKDKTLTAPSSAAVSVLSFLAWAMARKIDAWDVIVEWALKDAGESGGRPKVPQNDNVSLPIYLKFCESLGLTPMGRTKLVVEKKPEGGGGKLGRLAAVPKPA